MPKFQKRVCATKPEKSAKRKRVKDEEATVDMKEYIKKQCAYFAKVDGYTLHEEKRSEREPKSPPSKIENSANTQSKVKLATKKNAEGKDSLEEIWEEAEKSPKKRSDGTQTELESKLRTMYPLLSKEYESYCQAMQGIAEPARLQDFIGFIRRTAQKENVESDGDSCDELTKKHVELYRSDCLEAMFS